MIVKSAIIAIGFVRRICLGLVLPKSTPLGRLVVPSFDPLHTAATLRLAMRIRTPFPGNFVGVSAEDSDLGSLMTLFVTMARLGSEELLRETRTRRLVREPLHLEFDDVSSSNEKIYFPKIGMSKTNARVYG